MRRGVDDEAAVGLAMHVFVHHGGRIGREFADDLLEDVLERHESLDVAVFVHDERHAAFFPLKIQQLSCSRVVPEGTK